MHRVDPRTIDALMIRDVRNQGISTLRPWYYPRPETGSVRNHAVRFRAQFADKISYLRSIWEARLGNKDYSIKSYLYSFPKLPSNASRAQICDFLHRVCRHGAGFGVYVPPFATMVHDNHSGMWYMDLPNHCRDHWEFYDQVLHQALTGRSGNLGDSDLTRHLLAEFSGYQILWLLASIAGHPGVSITAMHFMMPIQRRDKSLHEYMQDWSHFLHLEHCRGVAYSDVYFVESWLERLHPIYNDNVKPFILSLMRDCTRDVPLPIHFSPEHLINFICSRSASIGLSTLTPLTTSSQVRRPTGSSLPPRATTRRIDAADELSLQDVRLLDEDLPGDIFATICSLMASSTQATCDLCQDSNHLVASCPILRRAINDPSKARRILSVVERERSSRGGSPNSSRPPGGTPSSSPRTRTPLRSNRTAATRAMALDADDTDEEATMNQLTDDEQDSHDESTEPDFP